jgi:hypothetical protein
MPKISQYPSMGSLTGSEILLGDQANVTSTATISQLVTLAQGGLGGVDSGAVNAYVITTAKPIVSLVPGQIVSFLPLHPNTTTATANVNGGGVFAIVDSAGNALSGGEVVGPTLIFWTGALWQLLWSLPLFNKRTSAEIAAGVTPTNYAYPPGHSRRFNFDLTGATDNTTLLQGMLDAAGQAAQLTGLHNEVTLYPGIYLVKRVYMHYSNVNLRILPGAVIKQTLTGITNNNTTGAPPAYAVIHINPLNYVNNPSSGAAGQIANVKIYGGGTVQGPNTVNPGSYQQFQMGVVANDCNSFWIEEIHILGCGGETLLGDPSSWFTCTDLRAIGCEFSQGGEVGFNNCRASVMLYNYMHDNWFQNGLGIDGDNVVIGYNRIRNMQNSGISFGGSGAHDLGANGTARDILCIGNVVTATGLANTGAFQLFMTDDGATTTPKYNIKVIGNIFDNHLGPNQIAADYAVAGGTVEFIDNTVTNLQGAAANAINIISGSATYTLRGNVVNPGTLGNAVIGLTVSSGNSPVVIVEESNSITGFPTGNINWSSAITLNGEFDTSPTLVLTGFAAGQNVPCTIVKKGGIVCINFSGAAATSTSTTMTLGTLAAFLRPTRTQNFRFPVIDNGVNLDGLLQIASTGVMTFFKDINGSAFTASGTKGLVGPYNITYLLT